MEFFEEPGKAKKELKFKKQQTDKKEDKKLIQSKQLSSPVSRLIKPISTIASLFVKIALSKLQTYNSLNPKAALYKFPINTNEQL